MGLAFYKKIQFYDRCLPRTLTRTLGFQVKIVTKFIFSAMGAAYGTAKSGVGIAAMAIMKPERIMKSVIPIIMAGIVAIYGVVVAVLISQKTKGATSIMEVRHIKTINIFLTSITLGLY